MINVKESKPLNKQEINTPEPVLTFLNQSGLRLMDRQEADSMASQYSRDLLHGLNAERASDLPMTNTGLRHVDLDDLTPGEEALVLVIGGTHVRAAAVLVNENRRPIIKHDKNSTRLYYTELLKRHRFYSVEEFYDEVLKHMDPFIRSYKPDAVGVIMAFGGKNVPGHFTRDYQPFEVMGKDFIVPDISRRPTGEVLFGRPGLFHLKDIKRGSIENDVPPLLVAAESKIGCFVASGFNMGLEVSGIYYITDAGGHFRGMPIHLFAHRIDEKSSNPGHGLLEKQIAGPYLGETFELAIRELEKERLIDLPSEFPFEANTPSRIINADPSLIDILNTGMQAILGTVARRILYRSAQALGILTGSAIKTFPNEFPEEEVIVPVEGPVLPGTEGFKQVAEQLASQHAGKRVNFLYIPEADIIGEGAIALTSYT